MKPLEMKFAKRGEELSVNDKAEDTIRKARYLAMTCMPYLSRPLTAMTIRITDTACYSVPKLLTNGKTAERPRYVCKETDDAWYCPTFAVDRQMRTYIHPMAVSSWVEEAKGISKKNPCPTCGKQHHHPLAYLAGVFVHEMWHPMRKHMKRAEAYQTALNFRGWNVAADLEINDNIQDFAKSTEQDRLCLPQGGQLPEAYEFPRDLLAEQYYAMLMEKFQDPKQKNKLDQLMPAEGRCGSGCDNKGGEYEGGEGSGQQEGVGEGELEIISRLTAEEIKSSHAKKAGNIPAGLLRWADEVLEPPRYDWRQETRKLIRYCVSRYVTGAKLTTYSRLSRISHTSNYEVILPTHKKPLPNVAIVFDTSGSVRDKELKAGIAEAEGVCRILKARLNIIDCDAEAHSQKSRTMKGVQLRGGGGTDMRIGIQKALDDREKPSLIIVFTDGESPFEMPEPRGTRVIICLCGPDERVTDAYVMPWMHIVRIKEEDE